MILYEGELDRSSLEDFRTLPRIHVKEKEKGSCRYSSRGGKRHSVGRNFLKRKLLLRSNRTGTQTAGRRR